MQILNRVCDVLYRIALWIGVATMIGMTAMVCANIVDRALFNSALSSGEELSRFMMIWSAMCGAAMAVRKAAHFRMDFVGQFQAKLPGIHLLPAMAAIVIGLLLVVQGSVLVELAHDQLATASEIPMSFPYLCLPFAGGLMVLFGIEAIVSPKAVPASHHAAVPE
ncbi:TRAP transporter small permease [Leptospira interrogans]